MKRRQLVEVEDLPWFPSWLRDFLTDHLSFIFEVSRVYEQVTPYLQFLLEHSSHSRVIDLCSGRGIPALQTWSCLKDKGLSPSLILTDKYPNQAPDSELQKLYWPHSVDVRKVDDSLDGIWTIFTAFHHFTPVQAQQILRQAEERHCPIAIFEITKRKYSAFFTVLFVTMLSFVSALLIRPFSFRRVMYTYLIPIVPFFILWDGIVSIIRSYSPDELKSFTDEKNSSFIWRAGTTSSIIPIVYLIGCPKEEFSGAMIANSDKIPTSQVGKMGVSTNRPSSVFT